MHILKSLKILCAALIGLAAEMTEAATKTWVGASSDWNYPNNWSPNGVPAAGDDIFFNSAGPACYLTGDATVASITFTNAFVANFSFNGYSLVVEGGNADFRSGGSLSAPAGSKLIFNGATTQVLTGSPAYILPPIVHDGTGTLQLSVNNLSTNGFLQLSGTLDLNGNNLATEAGGDFAIHNGGAASIANLGGRTLSVAGKTILLGTQAANLNLAPVTAWTLTSLGSVFTDFVTVGNGYASANQGVAFRGVNSGGNANWTVATNGTFYWNRNDVLTTGILNQSYNWAAGGDGTGFRPASASDDEFTSDALGGPWTFLDADSYTGGSYSLTDRADQLKLLGRGQDLSVTYNDFVAVHRSDITGNFDVTVKLLFQSHSVYSGKAGILIADDPTNLSLGGYCALSLSRNGDLNFYRDEDGNGNLENYSTVNSIAAPAWLRVVKNGTTFSAFYRTTPASLWTQVGTGVSIPSAAANSVIGLFSSAGSASYDAEAVFDDFQSGSDFAGTDNTLSFNGTGANADADATLGVNTSIAGIDFTGYTGTFGFANYILNITSGNATFVSGQGLTTGTGTLVFSAASGTQTFTPKSGATFPGISKSGGGTVTVATNGLWTSDLSISAGTWNWGASTLSHSVTSLTATGGTLTFGTNTVSVTTGDANLGSLGILNPGSGTLQFTGATGTQTFTPKSGATHPAIVKSGAGTLALSGTSLICAGYSQSAGTVQFGTGPLSLTTTNGLTLSGGTLDASTNAPSLSVGGNLTLTSGALNAASGSLNVEGNLDLSTGAGTLTCPSSNAFTVAGSFTVGAGATFTANSGTITLDATTTGFDIASNGGSFANLTFNGSGGGWAPSANLTATGTVTLASGTLDISANARQLTAGAYTQSGGTLTANNGSLDINGSFTMSGGNLSAPAAGAFTVSGGFDHTAGAIAANAGTLTLDGTSAVNFRTSSSLANVNFNGSGATWTWLMVSPISHFYLTAGTVNFGSGNTHAIGSLTITGGNLDFGSSTARVSGSTVNLNSLGTLTPGTGMLEFNSSSGQGFTPKYLAQHPTIRKSNPGTVTLLTNPLLAADLQVVAGGLDASANSLDLTLTGAVSVTGGTLTLTNSNLTAAGGLTLSSGTLICPGTGKTFQFGSGISYASGATLTHNSGTLTLAGTATGQSIDASGTGLNNLTVNGYGSTWTTAANLSIAGTFTLSAGTVNLSTNGFGLTAGVLSLNGGTLISGNANLDVNGNVTVTSGTFTMPASGKTFAVSGNVTQTGGTLTPGTGTLTLVGATTGNTLDIAATLNNLTVNGSGGVWTLVSNLTASGTFTLTAGTVDIETNIRTLSAYTFAQTGGTLSASTGNVVLTGDFNQNGGTFTAPGSARLFDIGGSLVQTGGTFTPGTGSIVFSGSATGNIVNIATSLNATTFSGSGEWTVTTNPLATGTLTLSGSTLRLGSGLTHSITGTASLGAGTLDFGSSTLRVHGATLDLTGVSTLTAGTGTVEFMGATAKTFTPKSSATTHPSIKLTGAATVTVATYNLIAGNLDVNAGTLDIGSRSLTVGGNATLSGGALTATNGGLDVNGNLAINSGALSCPSGAMTVAGSFTQASGSTLTHNSGSIYLDGTSGGKTLDVAGTLWSLNINGAGGIWTVANTSLSVSSLAIAAGTLALGSGLTHTVENLNGTGGTLDFGSSTLQATGGTVYLGGLGAVTPGTGTLQFTAGSGTQTLTPKNTVTHPHINHSGAGTLLVSGNDLKCLSLVNSAGILDITNRNVTTVSAGNFTISNGTSTTLSGLDGRTLLIDGNASLSGSGSANRLNLNPIGTWTLTVTGTVSSSLATIGNSTASGSSVTATNCANTGSNSGWNFAVTWDGGGGNSNWSTAANWASDYAPTSLDAVTFNSTSINTTLDANASVKSIAFTSGYTGTFSFGASTLTLNAGNADFQSGGGISAGTGSLAFTSSTAQTFIPKAGATFPGIIQNGTGGTTILTNALTAGNVTLTSGTLNLGSGLSHSIGGLSGTAGLDFGSSSLYCAGNVDFSTLTVTASTSNTLAFTGGSAQTYTPLASVTNLLLHQNGAGGTTVLSANITTPALTLTTGTLSLGTGRTHTVAALSVAGGGLDFGSSTLRVSGATVNLTSLATLTPGTGVLEFTGTSPQTFTPKQNATHPGIKQSGSGGTTLAANNLTAGDLYIYGGTFNLGTGRSHLVTYLGTYAGGLDFSNSQLTVNPGSADFSGLQTLTPGTGTLAFTATTGSRIIYPKASATHPSIVHAGGSAGILYLGANAPLTCLAYTQTGGTLNFNNQNMSTESGGNFTITNGTAASLDNLADRTLTVSGNLSLAGASSTNRMALNPTSAWYLNVAGTAAISLASVKNANASGGSTVACTNCANEGANTNWTFTVAWDGGAGDGNWSTAGNWGSDYAPTSLDEVTLNSGSANLTLDAAVSVKAITLTSGYTGTFAFSSQTLTVNSGNGDFRSGGAIAAGTGSLVFAGSGAQAFYPKSGATFPNVAFTGSGTTTVTETGLSAGDLSITSGTLNLGAGLDHSVKGISGSGNLNLGTSTVSASGNVNLASLAAYTETASNTLSFTGASAQTYTPHASATLLRLTQNGAGGTSLAANVTTPLITLASGTLQLGAGRTHAAAAITVTSGGLHFGSSLLATTASTVDFSALASLTEATGTLRFDGAGGKTFTPHAASWHPAITMNGSGTLTLAAALKATGGLRLQSGTLRLGSGLTHQVADFQGAAGDLDFQSSILRVHTGDADFSGLTSISHSGATLKFEAGSGTQNLTPKSGYPLPAVFLVGAGTLRLAGTDLACAGFTQTNGQFDLNGRNLSTSGNLSIDILTAPGIVGLAGRTLGVSGNAELEGTSNALLALNPGTAWNLNVAGSLTARYANLANCLTGGSSGTAVDVADLGGNSSWSFAINWIGLGTDNNWSTAANWGSGAAPTASTSVLFNGTSIKNILLDGNASVKSITMVSAYSGQFDFGSSSLTVTGTADFRSGGAIATSTSGELNLAGTTSQALYPSSGQSMPNLRQSGTGGTTLAGNLTAGNLSIQTGTFDLGTGFTHSVGALGGSGSLAFGSSTLNVRGNADFTSLASLTVGSGELGFTGSTAQVFLPGSIGAFPALRQNGAGGVTISNAAVTTPALRIDNGTFHLGTSGLTHTVTTTFSATSGGLDFGSSTLAIAAAAIDLNTLSQLDAGTGILELTGSGQTLAPKAGATHPSLTRNGSGTATLVSRGWSGNVLKIQNGTLNLGNNLSHAFSGVVTPNNGILEFNTSAMQVSGNADFNGLSLVDGGSGSLTFSATSGSQSFTPELGSPFPAIFHTGAGTLVLSVNDLSCAAFHQSAGALDLNGRNITVATGGSFSVSNGGAATLLGLSGRTLTIGGNATFNGKAGSRLSMAPGLSWALAVTGTLKASNVELRNCQATLSAGIADSSANLGGNTKWSFLDTVPPANISGLAATALNGHAIRLAWTAPASADADSIALRFRADGIFPASSTDGTLWRKVPATRTLDTIAGVPDKTTFKISAFTADSAGNWSGSGTGSQATATTPDVTPPKNVTALTATALSGTSVALAWSASLSTDVDSVQIRYRLGTVYPTSSADGTLWRTLSTVRTADTVTGLTANTIYSVGLFVRDSSGNYSASAISAQDSALWQNPVTGTVAFVDVSGFTSNPTPRVTLAGSGADSVRFSLLADTAAASWRQIHTTDSVSVAAGADGKRIAAAQFKNVFGTRSAWYFDTTTLDRLMRPPELLVAAVNGYLTWPNFVVGKAVDYLAGTDSVFVLRQRESDNAWFNGAAWGSVADTARLRADSAFAAPFASSALTAGFYNLTAWAKDKVGNVSVTTTARFRFDPNRAPVAVADSVRDSVYQNQPISWILELGDLDQGDSVKTVNVVAPAWLAKSEAADTAKGGFAARRVYTFAGKPGQAHVGAYTLTVQAKDVGGQVFAWSRSVKVVDINDPPQFAAGQDSLRIKEDSIFRFIAKYSDPDPQDKPVMSMVSGPAWASLADSILTLAPGSRDVGTALIRMLLSDGRLLDTMDLRITVQNVNDVPVAFPAGVWPAAIRWNEDLVDTFSVVVVDMDRNDIVALDGTLPVFLSHQVVLDSAGYNRTFRFTAKPGQQDAGSYNLKLRFRDQAGAFGELPLNAVVYAVNDMPTASIRGIETSGGAARAGLDAQDADGSLAQTRFHYRLIAANGDTVRGGICATSTLLIHPLADGAYRLAVAAEDEGGLRQSGFAIDSFAIQGATSLALDSGRWHMIAYPGRTLAASGLGAGATAVTWDEAAADGSPVGRYQSGPASDSLVRGKGYWVKTARAVNLSAASTDLLDVPFSLKLARGRQGWNQIGNPYPYSLDLASAGLTFWEWDAGRRDLVNARGLLKPWGAYWVQVAKDTVLTLRPEPWFPAADGKVKGTALAKAAWSHDGEWSLQLSLAAGPYADDANFLGITPVTRTRPDAPIPPLLADAPKFGDYIALHFDAPESPQGLASDIRPALDADEEWWDFSVENAGTGLGQATLAVPGLGNLEASGLHAFVVRRGEAIAMDPETPAVLAMEEGSTRYSLVVTPHADFAARLKGSFSLAQNYPNPASTYTTFRFFLPQAWGSDGKRLSAGRKLRLDVYDFAGRRVARVAEGIFKPGSHSLVWQVRSDGGSPLAAGNYVYRMETPGFRKSLKILIK